MFDYEADDKGMSINFKREANIILESITDTNNRKYKELQFKDVLSVIRTIESTSPQTEEDIDVIIKTISDLWYNGILSPLTLKDDEFNDFLTDGVYCNIRYPYIYKDTNGVIFNTNAFNIYVRNFYYHAIMSQVDTDHYTITHNQRIYYSKGGVINGEYIEQCAIKKDIVESGNFMPTKIVNIPISSILNADGSNIFVADVREPTLVELRHIYDTPVLFDEKVANAKYDIRKYKKFINK